MNHKNKHQLKLRSTRGSILIWSVMLGFVLTSVFFIFGLRQRTTLTVQRDTSAILNARAYAKSFADYLERNPSEIADENGTEFDIFDVSLSKSVDQLVGQVDNSNPKTYNFSDDIFVEWNLCGESEGDLDVNGVIYEHTDGCSGEYDDIIGPISVSDPFTIGTLNEPLEFRITGDNLEDKYWHLEVSTDLDYGRNVMVERIFE